MSNELGPIGNAVNVYTDAVLRVIRARRAFQAGNRTHEGLPGSVPSPQFVVPFTDSKGFPMTLELELGRLADDGNPHGDD